jgi:hypothetical protein
MMWSHLRIRGMAVRRALAFAAVGVATLLGGCVPNGLMARFQLKPDDIIIERRADPAYEKLFPYFVELCAASQFRSKLTGEGGGVAGHAVMYLKGACKDDSAPFPQLRRSRAVATSTEDRGQRQFGVAAVSAREPTLLCSLIAPVLSMTTALTGLHHRGAYAAAGRA